MSRSALTVQLDNTSPVNSTDAADVLTSVYFDITYLVKNTATFTFTGVSGYTEASIADKVVFGLGTNPDSTLTAMLPEPSTYCLSALVAAALVVRRARRRSQ